MKTESQKEEVMKLRSEGMNFNQIAKRMKLSRCCVRGICINRKVIHSKKRGRKEKLNKSTKLRIKRQISQMKSNGEKVNSTKLIKACDLSASRFTVYRHLKSINMEYKILPKVIPLKPQDKCQRVKLAKQWLVENHPWEKTIFSDEKWFSFDGPDGWSSFMYPNEKSHRPKRQKNGGGIMVWAMITSNGLISFKFLERNFRIKDYIDLLKHIAVPISKLNVGKNFWFQHDNARIHTAKIVVEWTKLAAINILEWPVRSADLNPAENVWKIICDSVYDGLPFYSADSLKRAIEEAILYINTYKRSVICGLYKTFRKRLVDVIDNCGNQI